MSVIAKLEVRDLRDFGSGQLIELGCVCENDLMAAYADSEEDRLFTKYSPWGDARVHTDDSPTFGKIARGDKFYVMLARTAECGADPMPGALMRAPARIAGLTNHGDGMAQTVEIASGHRKDPAVFSTVTAFSWRMSVDNPGATAQFEPGVDDYWIGFYPATSFDRNAAISAAHNAT